MSLKYNINATILLYILISILFKLYCLMLLQNVKFFFITRTKLFWGQITPFHLGNWNLEN